MHFLLQHFILISLVFSSHSIFSQPDQLSQKVVQPIFQSLSTGQTGIDFLNKIKETDQVNYFKYEYLFNGGGVAVGDLNQDGLPDLYFTGNMVPNRLYINRGDFRFEDVTAKAKASYLNDWCTGVSMVDINADGLLDIYICASGWYEGSESDTRRNILFVNQGADRDGVPSFLDQAAQYGLNDPAYSTQACFLDYDRDGDLDMYLGNHPRLFREYVGDVLKKKADPPADCRDKLYRNDNGIFVDVSDETGIVNYGHTLGVVTLDYDQDGWMDIYVSNDYQENDYLYRNQGDGTFVNVIEQATGHVSKFSMGVDANDFNNDGWTDILTVEMMAKDNKRQKTNMASMNPKLFWASIDNGFGYQYMHNSLQLNRQNGRFSEVAYLAGVATTDWSWAPLFADFDNDGFKDLFISNGYRRDVLDKDFKIKLKQRLKTEKLRYQDLEKTIPRSKQANFLFQNKGDLTFAHRPGWGLSELVNTNGAAYADLDLDGDLDLILNHMEDTSRIYRNLSREQGTGNYLQIVLKGSEKNPQGVGAKVVLRDSPGRMQYQLASPVRGYQSSVDPCLHFGVGGQGIIPELEITWPDQRRQVLFKVPVNQRLSLRYEDAQIPDKSKVADLAEPIFQLAKDPFFPSLVHEEIPYNDYQKQVLLPHKLSQSGPFISVADVNGDGLEDTYLGGSAGHAGKLLLQKEKGFIEAEVPIFFEDRHHEDQQSCWLDADLDGDLDLYVVSGSYEFEAEDLLLEDRLYLNDGKGDFTRSKGIIPSIQNSGSCVKAVDFDSDGDKDLFVGGRVFPGKYPMAQRSYLLQNEGGTFLDVSDRLIPGLKDLGMVTDACWSDYDQDGKPDLVVVGEWMPITVFHNEGKGFSDQTEFLGLKNSTGWWNCIQVADIDQDGDLDFVAGNLGTNSKNQATPEYPFHVYADDLDKSGSFDIVLGYYDGGIQYPVRGLQCSSEQVPELAQKIESYDLFGSLDLAGIYGDEKLQQSLHYEALEFRSVWLEQTETQWIIHPLPHLAQVAPTNGVLIQDLNDDNCPDLILVGNQYPVEVETGRYDAHQGLILLGDCEGNFDPLFNSSESGLSLKGDMRSIQPISLGQDLRSGILIGVNQGAFQLFQRP